MRVPASLLGLVRRLLRRPESRRLSPVEIEALRARGDALLAEMLGPAAAFRAGQWEAIEAIVARRERLLVVQRTGWGKSLVYFFATRLLREQGAGPTLIISPLLALMRNQVAMAERLGLTARNINSANRSEWDEVERAVAENRCDILLISPERLNSRRFLDTVWPTLRIGLLVVDEAHCISDWGHDFRPDYRRIGRIVRTLAAPVLGTTATANNRVVADVTTQLGSRLVVQRGPLRRETLRLQSLILPDPAERLAWLAEFLPKLPGSGIVYCLTVADAERVARWLRSNGIAASPYHAGEGTFDRPTLEQALLDNRLKALVATTALSMGFDKPDLGFVIHYQRPGSLLAYYQQVGRAGRAVERAYGILLAGREDEEIHRYFFETAFPAPETFDAILGVIGTRRLAIPDLLAAVNVSAGVADQALRLLEVEGVVRIAQTEPLVRYERTRKRWRADRRRIAAIVERRRAEWEEICDYAGYAGCLMERLTRSLDDPAAGPCGICSNCRGAGLPSTVDPDLANRAREQQLGEVIVIEPRDRLPVGIMGSGSTAVPPELQNEPGRALAAYAEPGWGEVIVDSKYRAGRFGDGLITGAAELIRDRWRPDPAPEWVTAIPSTRRPDLVPLAAERLADRLGLPFVPTLRRTADAREQKAMANSAMQARNVLATLRADPPIPSGSVLLVDDITDSGWTLSIAGLLLRRAGSGPVLPFAFAKVQRGGPA